MELIATKSTVISSFIFWLCIFESTCNVNGSASDVAPYGKILSRKRRYLIFPKGSSIQLVYDSVVTIPDYTIYVVTGVTCALAWGLPDQPIYPEDDLMHRYEQGGLPGIQYRNDVNVTENVAPTEPSNATIASSTKTATKIDNRTLMNLIRLFYTGSRRTGIPNISARYGNYANNFDRNVFWNSSLANNRITFSSLPSKRDHYYTRPPLNFTQPHKANHYLHRNTNNAFNTYMADTYFEPWIGAAWKMQTTRKSTPPNTKPSKKQTNEPPPFKPKVNKLHAIYAAIGKRSIRSASMTWEEKFYLDHHRNTRHKLYGVIEKYLFAKGFNGTACVLKTLCEVGKKRSDSEPGSFLAEIVRAIFSLPEAQTDRVIGRRHVAYDEAHQNTDDCVQSFINCPDSIWDAGYTLIEAK